MIAKKAPTGTAPDEKGFTVRMIPPAGTEKIESAEIRDIEPYPASIKGFLDLNLSKSDKIIKSRGGEGLVVGPSQNPTVAPPNTYLVTGINAGLGNHPIVGTWNFPGGIGLDRFLGREQRKMFFACQDPAMAEKLYKYLKPTQDTPGTVAKLLGVGKFDFWKDYAELMTFDKDGNLKGYVPEGKTGITEEEIMEQYKKQGGLEMKRSGDRVAVSGENLSIESAKKLEVKKFDCRAQEGFEVYVGGLGHPFTFILEGDDRRSSESNLIKSSEGPVALFDLEEGALEKYSGIRGEKNEKIPLIEEAMERGEFHIALSHIHHDHFNEHELKKFIELQNEVNERNVKNHKIKFITSKGILRDAQEQYRIAIGDEVDLEDQVEFIEADPYGVEPRVIQNSQGKSALEVTSRLNMHHAEALGFRITDAGTGSRVVIGGDDKHLSDHQLEERRAALGEWIHEIAGKTGESLDPTELEWRVGITMCSVYEFLSGFSI